MLLLVVEVGAVEHGSGLLLEQVVERQVAGDDAVVGGECGGVLGRRGGGFSWWLGFFFAGFDITQFANDPCEVFLLPLPSGEREG